MLDWWNNLDLMSQVYALVAVPATIILIIQTVLLLFGIGDGVSDGDGDGDFTDGDGMSVFTVRGLVAMFCVGGWSGLAMLESGVIPAVAILLSVIFGTAALLAIGYLMVVISKLQSNGNITLSNAVGKSGTVYIPIPPSGSGKGKINITIQDTFIEADAITTDDRKIATGETVRVVATNETGLLVVESIPLMKESVANAK